MDTKIHQAIMRRSGGVWPALWASGPSPSPSSGCKKTLNLFQDPFDRADFTSNTFWDWQLNRVGSIYGAMQDVFDFAATFKAFSPRSFPPSFVPTNIMEGTLREIRIEQRLREADILPAGPKKP